MYGLDCRKVRGRVSVLKTKGLLLSVGSLRKSSLKQFIQKQRTLNPRQHSSVGKQEGAQTAAFLLLLNTFTMHEEQWAKAGTDHAAG